MTIQQYVVFLIEENNQVSKIKITNHYNFNENIFNVSLNNNEQKTISVETYQTEDKEIVEFYNNDILVAKAKGFSSVL